MGYLEQKLKGCSKLRTSLMASPELEHCLLHAEGNQYCNHELLHLHTDKNDSLKILLSSIVL